MSIDLSLMAGFPLIFHPDKMDVSAGDIEFARSPRFLNEMKLLWSDKNLSSLDSVLYWNFKLKNAGKLTHFFDSRHLTYGLVLLPPGKIGDEFIKTHGHYHSPIPGSQIGYPEVYTHLFGELYLFMQRRQNPLEYQVDDCVLYKMVPGESITIPPGYAHILINPSDQPGLMAGLYSLDSKHNYAPIDAMAGAAYYYLDGGDGKNIQLNPAYHNPPSLRSLVHLDGTIFAPPDPDMPLWQSFVTDPTRYTFLYDADLTQSHFGPENLRV